MLKNLLLAQDFAGGITPPPSTNNTTLFDIIIAIILGVLIILALIWVIKVIINHSVNKNCKKNKIIPYTKNNINPPSITLEKGVNELIVDVFCKDNYQYVIIGISLYNNNNEFIKNISLRVDNLKIGSTKQLFYKLGQNDINISDCKYCIKEVK